MKKLLFLLALTVIVSANVWADPILMPDTLGFAIGGPGHGGGGGGGNSHGPHSPVYPPFVVKEGHTLYLYSGCDDTTLVLLDEEGEDVYSEFITEGTAYIVLPEWLEGTYELQIQRGSYVFYTEIGL